MTSSASPDSAEVPPPSANKAHEEGPALDENVQAIKQWERTILEARSRSERLSEWITSTAARSSVLLVHAIWFAVWIAFNVGLVTWVTPFDPFPFPFLTMVVSLEAIFLALFVLGSQNRLARQSDKRSHLDLQVDLLAECEMTAVLQLLQDIAGHLRVTTRVTPAHLRDLAKKTDLRSLTDRMEELAEPSSTPDSAGRA